MMNVKICRPAAHSTLNSVDGLLTFLFTYKFIYLLTNLVRGAVDWARGVQRRCWSQGWWNWFGCQGFVVFHYRVVQEIETYICV